MLNKTKQKQAHAARSKAGYEQPKNMAETIDICISGEVIVLTVNYNCQTFDRNEKDQNRINE